MYSFVLQPASLAYCNVCDDPADFAERGASFAFLYKLLISRKEI